MISETPPINTVHLREQIKEMELRPRRPLRLPQRLRLLLATTTVALSFAGSAISMFIMSELDFGPIWSTLYWTFVAWSSVMNPVIGLISDVISFRGERRRPVVCLGAILTSALYLLFFLSDTIVNNFNVFITLSILANWGGSCISVPLNGLLVELFLDDIDDEPEDNDPNFDPKKRPDRRTATMAKIQSEAMLFRSIGSLMGSILYTVFTIKWSLRLMLLITAVLYALIIPPLLILERSWCVTAKRAYEDGDDEEEGGACCSTCTRRAGRFISSGMRDFIANFSFRHPSRGAFAVIIVLFFVVIYTGSLNPGMIYYSYVLSEFSDYFPLWFFSFHMTCGLLGSVVSSFLYMRYMSTDPSSSIRDWIFGPKDEITVIPAAQNANEDSLVPRTYRPTFKRKVNTVNVFTFGCVCACLGYLSNIVLATNLVPDKIKISPAVYVPIDNFVSNIFSRFAFMPVVIIAAERCPEGYEAVVFSLFTVCSMIGGTISGTITAKVGEALNIKNKHYNNLWILLLICAISSLLPIIIAHFLPSRHKKSKHREERTSYVINK